MIIDITCVGCGEWKRFDNDEDAILWRDVHIENTGHSKFTYEVEL